MLDLTDAEKDRQLRSRLIEILNVLEGTPPVSTRLRPCWTNFLSIPQDCYPVGPYVRTIEVSRGEIVVPQPAKQDNLLCAGVVL